MKKTIAFMLLFAAFFTINAYAATDDISIEGELDRYMQDGLADELYSSTPDEVRVLLEELGQDELSLSKLLSMGPKEFFSVVLRLLSERINRPLVTLLSIIGVAVLCALMNGLKDSVWSESLSPVFGSVAVLCVITSLASPIIGCIRDTADAVRGLSDFMLSFIPVFSGIVTAAGQPVTATTYNMFLFSVSQVMAQVTVNTLVPLMCAYLALCLVGPVAPSLNLTSVAASVKSVLSWALGLMTTVFVALLSMQSMVSSSADTVAAKTAKFVIGGFVPVVGSALSDAFVAAQGCLRLLKTVVGAFGIVVAMLVFLPVLLNVIVWYFATNLGASAGDLLGAKEISAVMKSASNTLGILIAILMCFALMVIVSTTIIMMMGTGA